MYAKNPGDLKCHAEKSDPSEPIAASCSLTEKTVATQGNYLFRGSSVLNAPDAAARDAVSRLKFRSRRRQAQFRLEGVQADVVDDPAQALLLVFVLVPVQHPLRPGPRASASVRSVAMRSARRGLRPDPNPPASTRQPLAAPTSPRSLMQDSEQLLGQPETPILNLKGRGMP